jgi:hypothetical protein
MRNKENLLDWQKDNVEKIRAYHRKYRSTRREFYRNLNRLWIATHRDQYNASKYRYRDALKAEVIAHYSDGTSRCVGCGFGDIDALCLDHIADDGAEHRKALGISSRGGGGGMRTYEALRAAGYPAGIQVLCANCNLIKEVQRKRAMRGKGVKDAKPETGISRDHDTVPVCSTHLPASILESDARR